MFIPDPDFDYLFIPDPGSRGSKRLRIPDPDPQHWHKSSIYLRYVMWSSSELKRETNKPKKLCKKCSFTGALQHPGHGLVWWGLSAMGHQLRHPSLHWHAGRRVLPLPTGTYVIYEVLVWHPLCRARDTEFRDLQIMLYCTRQKEKKFYKFTLFWILHWNR